MVSCLCVEHDEHGRNRYLGESDMCSSVGGGGGNGG